MVFLFISNLSNANCAQELSCKLSDAKSNKANQIVIMDGKAGLFGDFRSADHVKEKISECRAYKLVSATNKPASVVCDDCKQGCCESLRRQCVVELSKNAPDLGQYYIIPTTIYTSNAKTCAEAKKEISDEVLQKWAVDVLNVHVGLAAKQGAAGCLAKKELMEGKYTTKTSDLICKGEKIISFPTFSGQFICNGQDDELMSSGMRARVLLSVSKLCRDCGVDEKFQPQKGHEFIHE